MLYTRPRGTYARLKEGEVASERAPFVAMREIGFFAGEISARPVVRTGGGIRLSKCRFQTARRRSKLVARKSNPPSIGHHPGQRLASLIATCPRVQGFFPHTASRDPRGARAPDHPSLWHRAHSWQRTRGSSLASSSPPSTPRFREREANLAAARIGSSTHAPRAHASPHALRGVPSIEFSDRDGIVAER